MDKFIFRSFELSEKEGSKILTMYSRRPGEFSDVLCTVSAELNGEVLAARVSAPAEQDAGFSFRLFEVLYFCTHILPLFNPLNELKDGLSSFPQPFPSSPQSDQ